MPAMADDEKQKEPSVSELKDIASNASAPEDKLQAAAAQAESALSNFKTASTLREAATAIKDPTKREKYLRDAYNKEIEAHGNSKKARMLQSGAFQGTVGGAGIGAVVAGGLGTVVGTVVGTVTAIPATAVGGLVGAGVGLGHGSWIKLGKVGEGKGGRKGEGKDGKEGDKGQGKEGEGGDENKENEGGEGEVKEEEVDVEDAVPNPDLLRQAAEDIKREREKGNLGAEEGDGVEEKKERKKPRKLNRQESGQEQSQQSEEQKTEKKKPRKIEVRSK